MVTNKIYMHHKNRTKQMYTHGKIYKSNTGQGVTNIFVFYVIPWLWNSLSDTVPGCRCNLLDHGSFPYN